MQKSKKHGHGHGNRYNKVTRAISKNNNMKQLV